MHFVVTARITPFNPGASPPPVSIPTLRTSAMSSPLRSSEKSSLANPLCGSTRSGHRSRPVPGRIGRNFPPHRAEVVTLESLPPQFILTVSGEKPYANMEVELSPLIYIQRPEYWGIEVVGHLPGGIRLPVMTPYTVSLPQAGLLGTKGIEIIGATRSERR